MNRNIEQQIQDGEKGIPVSADFLPCSICEMMYGFTYTRKRHMKNMHGDENGKRLSTVTCPGCPDLFDSIFDSNIQLVRHFQKKLNDNGVDFTIIEKEFLTLDMFEVSRWKWMHSEARKENERHKKSKRFHKLCPSFLKMTERVKKNIEVVASFGHYGHDLNPALSKLPAEDECYIKDQTFSGLAAAKHLRACVRKADLQEVVRVVEIPPINLKGQLVRNRIYDRMCSTPSCVVCPNGKEGDCMTSGVVYLMSCRMCGQEYIGETGRPLCIRVKEHLDGLKKPNVSTPWGEHRVRCHHGAMFQVSVSILARESDISARRTLEALWIAAKNPQVNRKDECIAITQELAPFVELWLNSFTHVYLHLRVIGGARRHPPGRRKHKELLKGLNAFLGDNLIRKLVKEMNSHCERCGACAFQIKCSCSDGSEMRATPNEVVSWLLKNKQRSELDMIKVVVRNLLASLPKKDAGESLTKRSRLQGLGAPPKAKPIERQYKRRTTLNMERRAKKKCLDNDKFLYVKAEKILCTERTLLNVLLVRKTNASGLRRQ
ncbi:unnamed protein product [Heligmosomoides polygyrus]|uniref:C2H2-type domain-containing protein n=1 Tax=Heligmosomoides polygyrus TaxID=6339 RepID=A0A183GAX4_HELPZ|nr:unnamed protein product [Heligmosomoides polygyrus]